MTGQRFESEFCNLLKEMGWWALNIPKNNYGAQPFDVISIKGDYVFAVDCKVCSRGTFDLSRIEDNQWTAFDTLKKRTNAHIGIVAFYNKEIYWIDYETLLKKRNEEASYINLRYQKPMYDRDSIVDVLGVEMI